LILLGKLLYLKLYNPFKNKVIEEYELTKLAEIMKFSKKIRVLYVEDDKITREVTQNIFEIFFKSIVTAFDGQDGFEKFQEEEIDLIITDINMPRLNGLEMAKKIREIDETVPIIIISAHNEDSFFLKSIQIGVSGYLIKPIDMEQLTQQLYHVVQKFKYLLSAKENLHFLKVYQKAIDLSSVVAKIDTQGIITYVNDAFSHISGYERCELLAQDYDIIRHPDNIEGLFRNVKNGILKDTNIYKSVVKYKNKENKTYYIDNLVMPVIDLEGDILEYIILGNDITKQKEDELKIIQSHKQTRDSIKYASLIQSAVIPKEEVMNASFKDYFITWIPKDTVGGDIWLFDTLRHKDECLLFYIDCTGHGVAGAFVTMIVKAIEREIVSKLKENPRIDISPASIMQYFNKTMKKLLGQEDIDTQNNSGWDGGIIYYNRRTQIVKFAGAETPLFYMDAKGEMHTIKGDRYSVGYKKCRSDYEYKETIIPVEDGMKFFCTTDGYLDQNGGEKGFPFGKTRFKKIIENNYKKPMKEIQQIFQNQLEEYESILPNNDRNDDITLIGFEINNLSEYKEDIVEEIVQYEGIITQNVIAATMDNLEIKIKGLNAITTLSTIIIEYCQNMMNYSKDTKVGSRKIVPEGLISMQYINNKYYKIVAKNIVSAEDKEKIEPKLMEIKSLDRTGIKKRYRELRRSGKNTHEKGGGIGLYEIAKVSNKINYEFHYINEDKYYFIISSSVEVN